jgi:hypothetical protein
MLTVAVNTIRDVNASEVVLENSTPAIQLQLKTLPKKKKLLPLNLTLNLSTYSIEDQKVVPNM